MLAACAAVFAITAPAAHANLFWNAAQHDFGSVTAGGVKVSAHTFTLTATCDGGGVTCTAPGPIHVFGTPQVTGEGFSIDPGVTNTCAGGVLATVLFPSSSTCVTSVRFSPPTGGPTTGALTLPTGPDIVLHGTGIGSPAGGQAPGGKKKKKCRKKKGKRGAAAAKKKKCKKK